MRILSCFDPSENIISVFIYFTYVDVFVIKYNEEKDNFEDLFIINIICFVNHHCHCLLTERFAYRVPYRNI